MLHRGVQLLHEDGFITEVRYHSTGSNSQDRSINTYYQSLEDHHHIRFVGWAGGSSKDDRIPCIDISVDVLMKSVEPILNSVLEITSRLFKSLRVPK